MKTIHCGVEIDSETPINGVYNVGDVRWEYVDNEICLVCSRDDQECLPWHEKAIGDWKWVGSKKAKKLVPDTDKEFAALVTETTVIVVWSRRTVRRGLCSPCYPGQADMSCEGDYLAYALPEYLEVSDED